MRKTYTFILTLLIMLAFVIPEVTAASNTSVSNLNRQFNTLTKQYRAKSSQRQSIYHQMNKSKRQCSVSKSKARRFGWIPWYGARLRAQASRVCSYGARLRQDFGRVSREMSQIQRQITLVKRQIAYARSLEEKKKRDAQRKLADRKRLEEQKRREAEKRRQQQSNGNYTHKVQVVNKTNDILNLRDIFVIAAGDKRCANGKAVSTASKRIRVRLSKTTLKPNEPASGTYVTEKTAMVKEMVFQGAVKNKRLSHTKRIGTCGDGRTRNFTEPLTARYLK